MTTTTFEEPRKCPHCDGKGYRQLGDRWFIEGHWEHWCEVCEDCDGTGFVVTCGDCGSEMYIVRPGKFQCPKCG